MVVTISGVPSLATRGDKDTFSERYLSASRALMRWASPSRRSDRPASAAGCLNPLFLIKIIIVLIVILLMPLFLLPMLIGRLATFGGAAVRYSSVVDMTSGEQARWGYGTLSASSDGQALRRGVAAIAARDPAFDPATLTRWAATAAELICASLTSADATPARTFMAGGLLRTYQALLELRTGAGVVCEGSWQAVNAMLVEALSTPLLDEVRVRLTCQGWCWERHGPSGLTLRGSPDARTWSEDLTFGRSAEAMSPAAGGLPARRCPSCGAPLDLGEDGACKYCRGIVTAGRQDWVLVGWRRQPW
jgi:hypothetical protein